jgi:DNA-binding XRE family transcriptional regulator
MVYQKENLEFIKEYLGYTDEELAEAMDVTRRSIVRWRDGSEMRTSSIKRLLELYIQKWEPAWFGSDSGAKP